MFASPSAKTIAPHRLALMVAAALYLAASGWHVLHGGLNADEGFYAVATRAVAQGEMPYRDFGFTQPPLVPYVNSLPMRFLGFGLFEQRTVNGLWASLAVAVAVGWLWRQSSPWSAVALLAGCALSAPWLYFMHLGKTYALTGLLTMTAALVFAAMKTSPARLFLLGLLVLLGTGTRLPAAPFFFLLWLCAHWPGRRPTIAELAASGAGLIAGALLVVLPFALAAPEEARFWIFEFHRVSVPRRSWQLAWHEIVTFAPAVWVLAAITLVAGRRGWRESPRWFTLLLVAIIALGFNLLPGGVYEEYGVPFLLPAAVAALVLVHRATTRWPWQRGVLLAILPLTTQLLAAPLLYRHTLPERYGTASMWLPFKAPPYNPALPAQLAGARHASETIISPQAPFLGPNLILATETGRAVPSEFRMSSFSLTSEMPAERAARLHLATPARLHALLTQPDVTGLAFFKRPALNYGWTMPSFGPLPDADLNRTIALVHDNFIIVYDEGDFLILARRPRIP